MSTRSRQIVLGLGLAGLLIEAVLSHPALAVKKVTLFKVTSPTSEIVIGLTHKDLQQLEGKDADAVEKALTRAGVLNVWEYGQRHGISGEIEEAPLRLVRLELSADIRVEPYQTKLKVIPITEEKMTEAAP